MEFKEYQDLARKTRLPTATTTYCLLNLSGEVGELHSLIAKSLRDGKKPDHHANVIKELGDILWQLSAIADDHAVGLDVIALANLDKLTSRKERNVLSGSGDNR